MNQTRVRQSKKMYLESSPPRNISGRNPDGVWIPMRGYLMKQIKDFSRKGRPDSLIFRIFKFLLKILPKSEFKVLLPFDHYGPQPLNAQNLVILLN